MSYLRVPYEISLWEDRLTLVDSHGKEYSSFVPNVNIVASYYKEVKIAIIGSNELDFPGRAVDLQLKQNVNGTNTLTFSIFTKYLNEDGYLCENPFLPFFVNERKVKLKYLKRGKVTWLDFVIKTIEEDSASYKVTYTATDLFINELSKNGYNLEFNDQLENNYGTVNQLGAKVLEGTDWQIGKNTETIQQLNEEALYEIILNTSLGVRNITTNKFESIPAGAKIYTFYSCVATKEEKYFQFLYRKDGQYQIDENRLVCNADSYYISFVNPENVQWPYFASTLTYNPSFRGERLVKSPVTLLDPVTDKVVTVYEDRDKKEVYCYSETTYLTNGLIQNLLINGQEFCSTSGWSQNKKESLQVSMKPDYQSDPYYSGERSSVIKYTQDETNFLFNSGFELNQSIIGSITKGDQYVARIKFKISNIENSSSVGYKIKVKSYQMDELGNFVFDPKEKTLFEGTSSDIDSEGNLIAWLTSEISISEQELMDNKYGVFISFFGGAAPSEVQLFSAQLFKRMPKDSTNIYCPGGVRLKYSNYKFMVEYDIESEIKTNYYYYYPNQEADSIKDIVYISIGEQRRDFTHKYSENFEKIRSITASGSNRFNLLQSLSETFECWCKFEVLHKDSGEILLRKDVEDELIIYGGDSSSNEERIYEGGGSEENQNSLMIINPKFGIREQYQQQKFVTFHKNIGQENSVGFVYGVNLKSIRRKIESSNVVTKLLVKSNSNKFAITGSCNISRAKENVTGENFILNFDHYISQGLLDYNNFYNDLYSIDSTRGWLGYYTRLRDLNTQIRELNEEKIPLQGAIVKLSSDCKGLKDQYDANVKLLNDQEKLFYDKTTYNYDEIPRESNWLTNIEIISLGNDILRLRRNNRVLKEQSESAELVLLEIEDKILTISKAIERLILKKRGLNEEFEKKYSRFIQEGYWNSEDYVDDNLYYLDALSVSANSARPKVDYTIQVIEISCLPEFENYSFDLGDITYMQDTDFFGWKLIDGIKTPFKEKIVVTELITNFDAPEKNTIKVQNYRTQFEDLFQRMVASTQKLEFQAGAYQRAADAVTSEGSITSEALADVFGNNNLVLKNAKNQSVIWDDEGITTTNTQLASEIIRIVSGGIFLSNSGGKDWTTGITASGINAKAITTGVLNTELITILNGNQPAFRWDKMGITAYAQENGHYNNNTFVRFNQFGLFGLRNSFVQPASEQEVWDNAIFALTWKGFKLQSENKVDGYLSITNTEDLTLYGPNEEVLLQLGRIGKDRNGNVYGLAIGNQSEGNKPLSSSFQGLVATKDYLKVGGWNIESNGLYREDQTNKSIVGIFSQNQQVARRVGNSSNKTNWSIIAGAPSIDSEGDRIDANFGVDFDGNLYATNANISGTIYATDGMIGDVVIRPDPNNPGQQILGIPFSNIEGKVAASILHIEDLNCNVLFHADDGSTDEDPDIMDGEVQLSQWQVTSEGLVSPEIQDYKIILTPTSIIKRMSDGTEIKREWTSLLE